jgi:hypothetical protein
MHFRSTVISALSVASVLASTGVGQSAVTQVLSRGDVAWNDSLNWSAAGTEFDVKPNPFNVGSTGGTILKVSLTPGSLFDPVRLDQDSGWLGNFASGEPLIYTDIQNVYAEIDFPNGVFAAGGEIQPDFSFASGYGARIEAFDSASASLGFFDVFASIDTPSFLGVQSAVSEIDKVRFSIISLTDSDPNDGLDPFDGFALNRVDFLKDTQPPGVPEGGGLMVVAAGAAAWVSLLWLARRDKRAAH